MTDYDYTYDFSSKLTGENEIYLKVYLDDDTTEDSDILIMFISKSKIVRFIMPYDKNNKKIPMGVYTSKDVVTLNAGEISEIINDYGNSVVSIIASGADAYVDFGLDPTTTEEKMLLLQDIREAFVLDTNWKIGVTTGTINYHVAKLG